MYGKLKDDLSKSLAALEAEGLYKRERIISSPQGRTIRVASGGEVLNFCANNYLGLANDPRVRKAAQEATEAWGYGLASVRFICGTQEPHKTLERRIADFLDMEDAILFSSCFDANGALFEPLLGEDCAIIADSLNHASIIDGIRLCKSKR
ncbi:MAG: kbl [Spirochaetes bacterium]|nr:MAG: kbl [Spirochaetota bacterium]